MKNGDENPRDDLLFTLGSLAFDKLVVRSGGVGCGPLANDERGPLEALAAFRGGLAGGKISSMYAVE